MRNRSGSRSLRRAAAGGGVLPAAIRRLARQFQQLERQTLATVDLSRGQALVLVAVSSMGQPGMAMLARELQVAPSTLTRVVDGLVRRGFLKRSASPDDRRVVIVRLTPAGRAALRRAEGVFESAHRRVVRGIPVTERARVLGAVRALSLAVRAAGSPQAGRTRAKPRG